MTEAQLASRALGKLPGDRPGAFGLGAARRLATTIADLGASTILVIHGRTSFAGSGGSTVVDQLRQGFTVVEFDDVHPSPEIGQIEAAVAVTRQTRPDVIVGLGGGSVLDTAKAAAYLTAVDAPPIDGLLRPSTHSRCRQTALILVPTTAGSGSEMTRFATVYADGLKYSLDCPCLLPDFALIDPQLLASVPRPAAVASGLDALCHAVESYWAISATEDSRRNARAAMAAVSRSLSRAVTRGTFGTPDDLAALAWGASLAGLAIDCTRTTAAHALSYPLTSRLGIPHGVAVALQLRWLTTHAAQATDFDLRGEGSAAELRKTVADINATIARNAGVDLPCLLSRTLAWGGFARSLAELDLPSAQAAALVREGLRSTRAGNHPRLIDPVEAISQFDPQE